MWPGWWTFAAAMPCLHAAHGPLSSPCGDSRPLEIIPISPHIHVVLLDEGGAKSWRSSAGRPKKKKETAVDPVHT
jgi:hypothetical protein